MKRLDEIWWNEANNSLVRRIKNGFAPLNATGASDVQESYNLVLSGNILNFWHDYEGDAMNNYVPSVRMSIFNGNLDVTNEFFLNATGIGVTGFFGSGSLYNTYFLDSCSRETELTLIASKDGYDTLSAVVHVFYGLNPDAVEDLFRDLRDNVDGSALRLNLSTEEITVDRLGVVHPAAITASCLKQDGTGFAAKFEIALSPDNVSYYQRYFSTEAELSTTYSIPNRMTIGNAFFNVASIRIRLYSVDGITVHVERKVSLKRTTSSIYWGARTSPP